MVDGYCMPSFAVVARGPPEPSIRTRAVAVLRSGRVEKRKRAGGTIVLELQACRMSPRFAGRIERFAASSLARGA